LKEQTQSRFALGPDINPIYSQLDCTATPASTTSLETKRSESSAPLPSQSEKVDFLLRSVINQSNQNRLEPPWIAWLRPLSWLTEQTHGWTERRNLHSFYSDNLTIHLPHNQQ
jgi:hypothetical protein